jgi:REP element-mobilizing transposase RayT
MLPLAYLLTFRCYASWLPGDARGCSERGHRAYGTPRSAPCLPLRVATARRLEQAPVVLDATGRAVVDAAIREHCDHADWVLHAINVRTNHVHAVLGSALPPERMMNQLKSWATRRLRQEAVIAGETRPWSRHGSTRHLWTIEAVEAACRYVVQGQGVVLKRCPTPAWTR